MTFFNSKKGFISLAVLIFALMMGVGAFLGNQLNNIFFKQSVQTKEFKGEVINILFMGIDARDAKSNSRSDTMILASIDPNTNKVAMVSIPRDTRIKNSAGYYEKINSVNYTEGPEAACQEVGKLLSIPVDYYVVTNFGGFGDIVDALGGVHIDVETRMYHADPVNPELAIDIDKGYQYLNGQQALAYVRYRGGPTADIGRTENQQKFIKALAAEMMQTKTILKLHQLIPEIYKNVHTNLPLTDMIYLAKMAQKLDLDNINAQTLPGYFYHDNITGASYWEADQQIASVIMDSLLKGETFKVVEDTPASARPAQTSPVSTAVAKPQEETVNNQDNTTGTDTEIIDDEEKDTDTSADEEGETDQTATEPDETEDKTTQPDKDKSNQESDGGTDYIRL